MGDSLRQENAFGLVQESFNLTSAEDAAAALRNVRKRISKSLAPIQQEFETIVEESRGLPLEETDKAEAKAVRVEVSQLFNSLADKLDMVLLVNNLPAKLREKGGNFEARNNSNYISSTNSLPESLGAIRIDVLA